MVRTRHPDVTPTGTSLQNTLESPRRRAPTRPDATQASPGLLAVYGNLSPIKNPPTFHANTYNMMSNSTCPSPPFRTPLSKKAPHRRSIQGQGLESAKRLIADAGLGGEARWLQSSARETRNRPLPDAAFVPLDKLNPQAAQEASDADIGDCPLPIQLGQEGSEQGDRKEASADVGGLVPRDCAEKHGQPVSEVEAPTSQHNPSASVIAKKPRSALPRRKSGGKSVPDEDPCGEDHEGATDGSSLPEQALGVKGGPNVTVPAAWPAVDEGPEQDLADFAEGDERHEVMTEKTAARRRRCRLDFDRPYGGARRKSSIGCKRVKIAHPLAEDNPMGPDRANPVLGGSSPSWGKDMELDAAHLVRINTPAAESAKLSGSSNCQNATTVGGTAGLQDHTEQVRQGAVAKTTCEEEDHLPKQSPAQGSGLAGEAREPQTATWPGKPHSQPDEETQVLEYWNGGDPGFHDRDAAAFSPRGRQVSFDGDCQSPVASRRKSSLGTSASSTPAMASGALHHHMNAESPQSPIRMPKRKRVAHVKMETCKRCNCKKSKCLKLYCDCFREGMFCMGCSCQNCENRAEYAELVKQKRDEILAKNPWAFEPKIMAEAPCVEDVTETPSTSGRHMKGCHCKKSLCLKKYCECFQAGVGCSDSCRCEGCENKHGIKPLETEFEELYVDPDPGDPPAVRLMEVVPAMEPPPTPGFGRTRVSRPTQASDPAPPVVLTMQAAQAVHSVPPAHGFYTALHASPTSTPTPSRPRPTPALYRHRSIAHSPIPRGSGPGSMPPLRLTDPLGGATPKPLEARATRLSCSPVKCEVGQYLNLPMDAGASGDGGDHSKGCEEAAEGGYVLASTSPNLKTSSQPQGDPSLQSLSLACKGSSSGHTVPRFTFGKGPSEGMCERALSRRRSFPADPPHTQHAGPHPGLVRLGVGSPPAFRVKPERGVGGSEAALSIACQPAPMEKTDEREEWWAQEMEAPPWPPGPIKVSQRGSPTKIAASPFPPLLEGSPAGRKALSLSMLPPLPRLPCLGAGSARPVNTSQHVAVEDNEDRE